MTQTRSHDLQTGLLYATVYQFLTFGILLLFVVAQTQAFSFSVFKHLWNAWDANSYTFLSSHGYVTTGEESNYIVFYPLYPTMMTVVQWFFVEPHIAGFLVSTIGSIIGHTALFVFLRERGFTLNQSRKILLLFCVNPMTIYFTLICTEGIFLALCSLFFLFLYRRSFLLAAVCGALATSTRLLGLPLFVAYFSFLLETKSLQENYKKCVYACIIPLGFLVYLSINFYLFGSPFYYQAILRDNWFKTIANPLTQYLSTARSLVHQFPTDLPTYGIDQISTLCVPIIVGIYIWIMKKNAWWTGISFVGASFTIIAAQSYWLSNMRYIGILFPLCIMIERITRKSAILYTIICCVFSIATLYSAYVFSVGGWIY